jgi:alpha-beta hydrolase superfamily lysophospholipase
LSEQAVPIDYSAFDPVSAMIFYPRPDFSSPPPGAMDLDVPVEDGEELGARFHPRGPSEPIIVLFHGNGEVVGDYDDIAGDYLGAGAGLVVIDFRGYGRSSGRPLFSSMIADARSGFEQIVRGLQGRGHTGPLFVMGRSLGTHCALEVAACFPEHLAGLVIESGSGELARLAGLAGVDPTQPPVPEILERHAAKLRSIELPVLMIHGEVDELIPLASARETLERLGSARKHLEVIARAGHNDLWWLGRRRYFEALAEFIARESAP